MSQTTGLSRMPDYDGRRSPNALVAKLSRFASLSDDDVDVLEALCSKQERVEAGMNLVDEGSAPRRGFVITRGLACRYRGLPNGNRQILAFLIPGDFYDLHAFLLSVADHSVATMVPTRLARIERDKVFEIVEHHPRIGAALWWSAMQEAAMLRERIVMLGRRNALARIAYLFCELLWRHRAIGLTDDHTLPLPLTQADIADTLGLTAVHVNRVLQDLRREGLITLAHRRLTIHHVGRLQGLAQLNQDFLHLTGVPAEVERYLERLVQQEADPRRIASSC
jgi:CRP-like cAMP-binding protein